MYYGPASCPGSDGVRPGGDRRRWQEQDGHPADGACPGWEQRGYCRGGQRPPGSRGPLGGHGCRDDRFVACPGWERRGCSRGEEHRGAARAVACQRHPRVMQGRTVLLGPAPWDRARSLQEPWLQGPSVTALGATAPQGAKGHEAHQPSPAPQKLPEPQEPLPQELPEQREPHETLPQAPRGRQQWPGLRGWQWLPGTQGLRAWPPTSWGQGSPGRPWQTLSCRSWQQALRGRTRAPYERQGARWSRMPT